jgi:tetratricopeptide (TPR) repeat protein
MDRHGLFAAVRDPALVSEDKLAVSRRPALRFRDFAYLRFAEGIVGMHRGKIADALRHLTAVLNDARDLNDSRLMISGNYFVARCYRIKGLYDVAEEHAIEAQHLSEQQNGSLEKQVAVIQILRAWLLFQKGDHAQAKQILEMAKTRWRIPPTT